MRNLRVWLVFSCVLAAAIAARADSDSVDCSKKSLADAVANVTVANHVLSFTGVCVGPIVIAIDGLTLQGVGTAIIDGGGHDAVTITGASRVALAGLEVTNGMTGIVAREGAHVSLTGVSVHDNAGSGVVLQTASTAVMSGALLINNGRTGLSADNGAGITVESSTITGNTMRDIQLTFATRADLRTLVFGTYTCDATVLVRGTSGIICPH